MSASSRLAHYRRLESQLATARQAVAGKQREIDDFLIKESGIEPGDLVTVESGETARVVKVVTEPMRPVVFRSAYTGEFGRPWLRVNLSRADGTWSHAVRIPYTWTFVCRPGAPDAEVRT